MEILKQELNGEQFEIAKDLGKNVLVIAGPGSGKTRLLIHRIGYDLRSSPGGTFKTLCLTFTTEAAKELATRISHVVPENERWRVWTGNFHQFGQHLLSSHGHLIGYGREFEVIDEHDASDLLEEVLGTLGIRRVDPQRLYRSISAFRGRVNRPSLEELAGSAGRFDEILERYGEAKKAAHVMDFDDLIELPLMMVQQNPHLRSYLCDVYSRVYVDELQDTSLLQLELLKALVIPESSVIVGVADEDQVLYEWRDARLKTIREFESDFDAEAKFLVLNHRSPEPIVSVANALISNNEDRYGKELKSAVLDRRGMVGMHEAAHAEAEADYIAEQVALALAEEEMHPRDFAILGRVNWLLEPVKQALSSYELPFVHVSDPEIQNSVSARLIKGSLRLAAGHADAVKRLARPIEAVNALVGSELLSIGQMTDLVRISYNEQPHVLVRRLLIDTGLETAAAGTPLETQLAVAQQVVEAATASGLSDLAELRKLLVLEWNRLQSQVLNSQDKVKVMTIHQAKGLEFPVVYVPRLEAGHLPYQRRGTPTNVPEERRLLFVAITRAQSQVVLSYSGSPSGFLSEIAECGIMGV